MPNVLVNDDSLKAIGNAIREKNGETTTYKPAEMAAAITAISGGSSGYIPTDEDLTIQDMQRYTRTLIEDETNISTMVEKALRENAKEDEEKAKNAESDIVDDADLSIEELEKTLKDSDYTDFEEFKEQEAALDNEFLQGLDE